MNNNDTQPLMVSIWCMTYNHESYIRQCLEGFVMQKTNFCFEAVVHDDASTDGTATIVREYAEKYPDIIKPIFETENQYSKNDGSLDRIFEESCKGKYIALCEGDDYWIDSMKLQKQVDYLEKNPNCTFCHTGFSFLYQKDSKIEDYIQGKYKKNTDVRELLLNNDGYRIQTVTVMYKLSDYYEVKKKDPILFSGHFRMGDTQLWVTLLTKGEMGYLNEVTSVYRVLENSASRQNDNRNKIAFDMSALEMRLYLRKEYVGDPFGSWIIHKIRYYKALLLYLQIDKSYTPAFTSIWTKLIIKISGNRIISSLANKIINNYI